MMELKYKYMIDFYTNVYKYNEIFKNTYNDDD